MNTEECCNHNCNQGRDCPLRKKDLTDEEVLELWAKKNKLDGAQGIVDFARAILRKAQKK